MKTPAKFPDITEYPAMRFIRMPRVLDITGLTKSGLSNAIARGEFPRPVMLSARHTAWVEHEVREYQARKVAEREAGVISEKRRAVLEARRRGGLASAAKRAAAAK